MKNILLPTDFSDNSLNAIDYALHFCKNEPCTFYLLHVQKASHYTTDDLITAPADTTIHQSIFKDIKKQLERIKNQLSTSYLAENYTFHTLTDYDTFTDAINQVVISKNIDLIVMGTNGATGAKEIIFGSNTLNVIRKVPCTTLIIPEGFRFKTPTAILYAMDNDDTFIASGISPLLNVITKFNTSLRVLKIKKNETITVAEFNDTRSIKEYFKNFDYTFHSIVNIPTALAIDSFVQIMDIDMTAMFMNKETLIQRFLKGSETSKISYGTSVPLLIMHHQ